MDQETLVLSDLVERLTRIYERLKTLNQWNLLKQDEMRRNLSGGIHFWDNPGQDIVDLYSEFSMTAKRAEQILQAIKRPSDSIACLKRRIDTLCNQIYYWGSGIRFI